MGLLTKDPAKQKRDRLADEVAELRGEITRLIEERNARKDADTLEAEIAELKQLKQDAELALQEVETKHERETREIEHKLGLHRQQVEFEREKAVEEARLAVQKENLNDATERLKEQAEFQKAAMEREMDGIREMNRQILSRLPDVQWQIKENRGAPALPAGDGDDADVVDD